MQLNLKSYVIDVGSKFTISIAKGIYYVLHDIPYKFKF